MPMPFLYNEHDSWYLKQRAHIWNLAPIPATLHVKTGIVEIQKSLCTPNIGTKIERL